MAERRKGNSPLSVDDLKAMKRIEEARRGLIQRGFHCLSGGKFGLPSYSDVEAWGCQRLVVYFLFDRKTGGWDILTQLDHTNEIESTWKRLESLMTQYIQLSDPRP